MIRVIFNADDFGFSKGVNKGVAYCMKKGIVSSTSLLTNMPSTENAFSMIKKNKIKDVGIHLNISIGRSINGKSSLTDNKGNFIGAYLLHLKLLFKFVRFNDIEDEFKSQIEYMIDRGVYPNHIDSHVYVHSYKSILNICIKLAKKYNIPKIRNSYDSNLLKNYNIFNFQYYILTFVNTMAKSQKKILHTNYIKTTDFFHGIMQMGSVNPLKYFIQLINNLKEGTHEIMCHPGYVDEELRSCSSYTFEREPELKALCSSILKRRLIQKRIKIIGFNDL